MKRDELIGTYVTIVESRQQGLAGLEGKTVDETASFLIIESARGRKRIRKQGAVFLFKTAAGQFSIRGDEIALAPEERIKVKK